MINSIHDNKKLAILAPVAGSGGVQKIVVNLVNGLVSEGWPIDVICADAHEGLPELDARARLLDMGVLSTHGDLKLIKGFQKIRSTIHRGDYSALVTVPGFAGQIGILACLGLSTRVVVMADNKLSLLKELGGMHGLQLKTAQLLYPKADAVVAAHNSALADLKRMLPAGGKAVQVRIYHPLIPEDVVELSEIEPKNPIRDDQQIVVAAGRLVDEKDFPTLLRAFALVRQRQPAELIILGDGPLRNQLTALARKLGIFEFVRFEGMVNNVYSYFSRSSVFVLSSKREAFGNVLIEALASGTPCVATSCASGGPQEILADGKYGSLVEIGDVQGMAEAITQCLEGFNAGGKDSGILVNRSIDFTIRQSALQYSSLIERLVG